MSTYSSSQHHSFDVKLAIQFGSVDLAILVHHLQFWINKNQSLGRNYREGRTWTYQTREDIAACLPYYSPDKVRRLAEKLVKMGILKKGNFNQLSLDKTTWYAFVNEEMFTMGKSAQSTDESAQSMGKFAQAIPDSKPKSKTKGFKELGLETSAHDSHHEKNLDVSRRWKLNPEQREIFDWLKSKEIDAEDKKLAYWAKNYSLQRLIDVYNEAAHYKARSFRTYMSNLLEGKKVVKNANIVANAELAKDFAKENGWHKLKINQKYVSFPLGKTTDEISMDMDPAEFIKRLMQKFEIVESQ